MKVLDTGTRSAQANMDLDATLLEELEEPLLHFYDWEGEAATHGYFIQPEKFLNLKRVKAHKLSLARRPTGGGIVFHNCDLAFSVLIPATHPSFSTNPLDNYAFINRRVVEAIAAFCQTSPDLCAGNLRFKRKNQCFQVLIGSDSNYDLSHFRGTRTWLDACCTTRSSIRM